MEHIDQALTAKLYRVTCPSAEELGEYHLQMLPGERATAVAQHLRTCPHCVQELTQLETYLRELAPELTYTLRERVQIWIAQRLPSDLTGQPGFAPALALRGEVEEPLMYEAGDYQLNLEIQEDPAQSGRKAILGLLLGAEEVDFAAQLWQNGRRLQTTTVDDLGNFVFAAVPSGTYDLILSRLTAEIHVPAFTV